MSVVEVIEGGIKVQKADGRFRAVKTPVGFTDLAFRHVVSAYDAAFRTLGKLPSVSEVQEFTPSIPQRTISALLLLDEFRDALKYRGIEMTIDSGLSLEQSMLLHKLTDFTDRRGLGVKLKELSIPMSRYQAWMRQPLFKESYHKRTEDSMRDAVPLALNKLIGNVDAGDQRAIEKVLEITGRWNPAQQQIEDVKRVVVLIIEAVIRHVPDVAQRKSIMDDVTAEVASYTLIEQSQLPRG